MLTNHPKISVIIICYNQENIISRAIDSVICQKDYLHELIISDDCSSDKTWSIIENYKKLYPIFIKIFRNNENLGVYENLQGTYDKVSGELIFLLSGDDEFGKELFKKTSETLIKEKINYKTDRFCVITDYKVVFPNKTEIVKNNNSLIRKYDPFSLKFRGVICNRAFGESITTFKDKDIVFFKRKQGSTITTSLQEGFTDNIPYVNTKIFYYIPYVGNIYHAGIGISTKFNKNKKEYLRGIIEYCDTIPKYFNNLNKYDINWLNFHRAKTQFIMAPNLTIYWKYFIQLIYLAKDPLRKYFLFREVVIFIRGVLLFIKNQ